MKLLLPEVGANQHWPYGLVGDEKSYARQVDGNFFADVKNSSFFLKALKEDAGEKQVDADAHLKTVRLNAKKFMQGNTIVDRNAFIQSLTDAIFEDGLLTLILGGKSVGKSTIIRSVVANFTQAKRSQRTVVFTDMREMPSKDFFTAVLSTAPPLMALRSAVSVAGTSIFIRFLAGVLSIVPKAGKLVADSLANLLDNMDGKMREQGFVSLVRRAGKGIAIIVDEANLALPKDGNDAKAETAKAALAQITASPSRISKPLSSSSAPSTATPSSWPKPVSTWSTSRALSSLRKCRRSTCSRCSPTTGAWATDWHASSWPPTAVLFTQSTPLWAT